MKHLQFEASEHAVTFPTWDLGGFRTGIEETWRTCRSALIARGVNSVSVSPERQRNATVAPVQRYCSALERAVFAAEKRGSWGQGGGFEG